MDELKNISPIVNKITRTVPYTVPNTYFLKLSAQIKMHVQLHANDKINPYNLPDDYFNHLTLKTLTRINSSSVESVANYIVPENYFESLPNQIFSKIKAAETQVMGVYDELESIAPLLNKIPKHVFETPAAYFENLNIPSSLDDVKKQDARIIPIKKKNWTRYLAAASSILVIAFTTLLYVNYDQVNKMNKMQVQRIASVNVDQGINTLSDKEILEFLEEQDNYSIDDGSVEFGEEVEATELMNN